MDEKLTDELIEAILSPLEAAEARSLALMRALTETGTISEEKLKPFLEQAESASEIKARGLRIRLKRVLADVGRQAATAAKQQDEEKQKKKEAAESEKKSGERVEGPGQDFNEEAREHPAATSGREDQPALQNDETSERQAKQDTHVPKEENAA